MGGLCVRVPRRDTAWTPPPPAPTRALTPSPPLQPPRGGVAARGGTPAPPRGPHGGGGAGVWGRGGPVCVSPSPPLPVGEGPPAGKSPGRFRGGTRAAGTGPPARGGHRPPPPPWRRSCPWTCGPAGGPPLAPPSPPPRPPPRLRCRCGSGARRCGGRWGGTDPPPRGKHRGGAPQRPPPPAPPPAFPLGFPPPPAAFFAGLRGELPLPLQGGAGAGLVPPPGILALPPAPPLAVLGPPQTQIAADIAAATGQDEDGDTALHIAVAQGAVGAARRLVGLFLQGGCHLDVFNRLRQTPLHVAVITRQAALVRLLVAHGACPGARDRLGRTAPHLACERRAPRCLRELLRGGPDLQARDYEGHQEWSLAAASCGGEQQPGDGRAAHPAGRQRERAVIRGVHGAACGCGPGAAGGPAAAAAQWRRLRHQELPQRDPPGCGQQPAGHRHPAGKGLPPPPSPAAAPSPCLMLPPQHPMDEPPRGPGPGSRLQPIRRWILLSQPMGCKGWGPAQG
ncbi:atherin-like isoform X2 [Falco rusticolus]|uniref:atherin-like isoform X2 n=1 Tax=Falco rusticolus TaxID=120794 RepID=UPI0018866F7A|nr:atherin-like isoform X2 [Falco rusticolus]